MRKLVLFLALIFIFSFGAFVQATPVTITFWHAYNEVSPENEMLVKTLIPMFEKEHPDTKVQSLAIPYDQLHQKVLTSVAGGVAPDVMRADIIWVPEFASLGILVPMNKEFANEFNRLKSQMLPGPLSTNAWKGDYYGLPLDTNTRILFWNKTLFDAAGLKPPTTWEDFASACEKLTKKSGDQTVQWGFAESGTDPWHILPWIWSGGGNVTDQKITKASGYLNGNNSISALTFLVNLFKKGYISPSLLGGALGPYEGYAQGKYAMIIDGPWTYPIFEAQYPNVTLSPALIPAKKASISVVGGEDIVMFSSTKYKKEAWEFVKFMLSKTAQLKMAETGQMPILKTITEKELMAVKPYYGTFSAQLRTARARTPHPSWPKIQDILNTQFAAAFRGTQTPKQALDEAAVKIDLLLK